MLETQSTEITSRPTLDAASRTDAAVRYRGPDRRRSAPMPLEWLSAALDELDYGVLLLAPDGEIVHLNHAAAVELDAAHPLRRSGHHLQARCDADAVRFQEALRNASQRRLRKLVFLGRPGEQVGVSVVPLGAGTAFPATDTGPVPTLLVLSKRRVCESLSMQGFAGNCQLTHAESRVLGALCSGLPPAGIAQQLGVAISTVRTHIGTIRVKTGAESIRALVAKVARLPPLIGALRQSCPGSAANVGDSDKARDWIQ